MCQNGLTPNTRNFLLEQWPANKPCQLLNSQWSIFMLAHTQTHADATCQCMAKTASKLVAVCTAQLCQRLEHTRSPEGAFDEQEVHKVLFG